jgi:hypothetical protein
MEVNAKLSTRMKVMLHDILAWLNVGPRKDDR